MRYLLVVLLFVFSGCATATKYDKKQDQVMMLSANKYVQLLKKYEALKKDVEREKAKARINELNLWGVKLFVDTVDKNTNKTFPYATVNRIFILQLQRDVEKLKQILQNRKKKKK